MALQIADRVKETSTTTGTGSITLAGAQTGYQSFNSALTSGNTTYYCVTNQSVASEWEVGIGTFTSPTTLARTTVLSSSNSGSLVSFSAGTKDVFVTQPAARTDYTPVGTVIQSAAVYAPTGYLSCNGLAVSRTTYANLWSAVGKILSPCTLTLSTPGIVSWSGNGFKDGDPVIFTTTGALPTGLTAGTTYYVKTPLANSFNVAATPGGTGITFGGSQSGTHTATVAPFGVGDGATTFNVPDMQGRTPIGSGTGSGLTERAVGATGGEQTHLLTTAEMPSHTHTINESTYTGVGNQVAVGVNPVAFSGNASTNSAGGGGSHNVLQPYLVFNYYIKT